MIEPATLVSAAVAQGASEAISRTTTNFVENISKSFVKKKIDEIRMILNKGLPKYLEVNYAKCSTLKTLLNRNDPVKLADCFVAPCFNVKKKIFQSHELLDEVNASSGKTVVTGLAGSGKSVFLKYAFTKVIEAGHTYYPIFFELRQLNRAEKSEGMLLNSIYKSVFECCPSFTRAQFEFGLENGSLYMLLDGYDELNQDLRDQVSTEINKIARIYSKRAMIVTSRPSEEFISWEGFNEAKLMAFDLKQVTDYIAKLQFDEEKKRDFIADLNEGLFKANKEFLSNPLLAAMMLLTYDSFGEIPEKRHIFYAKCFDVLAREHDASKGRYKRELYSRTTIDQLENLFMFFCAFSDVDRVISFNEDQMQEYVKCAIGACALPISSDELIADFRESISIIEKVGLFYEFAHRSFQEYFYAKFVVTDRKFSLEQKISAINANFVSETTVGMIADMDPIYFESDYLLPQVQKMCAKFEGTDALTNPAGILSKFFSDVVARADNSESIDQVAFTIADNVGGFGRDIYLYIAASKAGEAAAKHGLDAAPSHETSFGDAEILKKYFNGSIKIHHKNNKKLIAAGLQKHAARVKVDFEILKASLLDKQKMRNTGLGALMRERFGKG